MIAEWIDRVGGVYATGRYAEASAAARREFRERTGRTLEAPEGNDADLEAALLAFLEWYVLDRPLADGLRPIDLFLRDHAGMLAPDDLAALRGLAASHRSVFAVVALGDRAGEIRLRDLILGGAWAVRERRAMAGVEPGDVLEARLVPCPSGMAFGPSFLFHPREARAALPALCRHLHERGVPRLAILEDLSRRRLRCERYRNVAAERVYAIDG